MAAAGVALAVAAPRKFARISPSSACNGRVREGLAHYTLLRDGAYRRTVREGLRGDLTPMSGFTLPRLGCLLIRSPYPVMLAAAGAVMAAAALVAPPAQARGPDNIADVAEKVINAVVNISTSQSVEGRNSATPQPLLPPGSPFEEFFDEFFKNRRSEEHTSQLQSHFNLVFRLL